MSTDDDRPVIAEIGGIRIVRGDSWWDGAGGAWALLAVMAAVLLVWIAGVVVVIWALVGLVAS